MKIPIIEVCEGKPDKYIGWKDEYTIFMYGIIYRIKLKG